MKTAADIAYESTPAYQAFSAADVAAKEAMAAYRQGTPDGAAYNACLDRADAAYALQVVAESTPEYAATTTSQNLLERILLHFQAGYRVLIGSHVFGPACAAQFTTSRTESGIYIGTGKNRAYATPSMIRFIA